MANRGQTGKFLKKYEYQTILPASWEICMQVKKQQLGLDMKQWTDFKLVKESTKALYCLSPCLLNFYAEDIMLNSRLGEVQAEIKVARRNINNLRCADTNLRHHSYGRMWRGTEELLDEGERGECKSWLKTQYSKYRLWHFVSSFHGK